MTIESFLLGLCRVLGPFFFELFGACFLYASFRLLTFEPQLQTYLAFGVLCSVTGIALLIYGTALHAMQLGQLSSIKPVYDELKAFFSSPMFFILYGSFLLYAGLALLDYTHSAFVFILSILGVAMILFGTGSAAVVAAETPTPLPARSMLRSREAPRGWQPSSATGPCTCRRESRASSSAASITDFSSLQRATAPRQISTLSSVSSSPASATADRSISGKRRRSSRSWYRDMRCMQ